MCAIYKTEVMSYHELIVIIIIIIIIILSSQTIGMPNFEPGNQDGCHILSWYLEYINAFC